MQFYRQNLHIEVKSIIITSFLWRILSMNLQMTILRLLQQLFTKTARQSKAFDRYQKVFSRKLHSSPSEKNTIALLKECMEQLNAYDFPLEDTLSEGRLIASQSKIQLQKIEDLSEYSQKKIKEIGAISPYSLIEYHNELTELIKIYQRVVIELNNNKIPLADDFIADDRGNTTSETLQQLILGLDFSDTYIKRLDEIRLKLSNSNDPHQLPEYCISIIAIIIDSTRDERRSSRHFLYTLNDSLTQFYTNFAHNIKSAENYFSEQNSCIKTIQKKSTRLKNSAEQAIDMATLRNNIFSYVESVEKIITTREKENEVKVHQQLKEMEREIQELQNETKSYQNILKQQNKQLHTDFLTKIPNRAAWSERLETECRRCKRYKNPLNLAVIDIDKFKKINDTFGHLAGDKVLNIIAQTLQKSLRNVDFIARYGGEEFAVLLPEVNLQQMYIALEKLRSKIEKIPFKFKQDKISITISIGCTRFGPNDDAKSIFERADQALYKAKNSGRNQIVYLEYN